MESNANAPLQVAEKGAWYTCEQAKTAAGLIISGPIGTLMVLQRMTL